MIKDQEVAAPRGLLGPFDRYRLPLLEGPGAGDGVRRGDAGKVVPAGAGGGEGSGPGGRTCGWANTLGWRGGLEGGDAGGDRPSMTLDRAKECLRHFQMESDLMLTNPACR